MNFRVAPKGRAAYINSAQKRRDESIARKRQSEQDFAIKKQELLGKQALQQEQLRSGLLAKRDEAQRKGIAREAERQRSYNDTQAALKRRFAANQKGLDLLAQGIATPEQAATIGVARPGKFGYRFNDIGALSLGDRVPSRSGILPKAPNMMKVRNDLFQQFYGKGRGGSVLRKQYDGDFGKYMADVMADVVGQYGQPPAQQPGSLPAAPAQQAIPTQELVQGPDGVWTNVPAVDQQGAEQYAQSRLSEVPAVDKQGAEQYAKKVQATSLPSPQDFDPMSSPAFAPPPSLEEFIRKQRLKKGVKPLPVQERMKSLMEEIERVRSLRAGAKRYY